jgi:hypothetical protein
MKTFTLTKTHRSNIIEWVQAEGKASGMMTILADTLYSDGCRADMLRAPEKGSERGLYDSMLNCIVAGFTVEARAVLVKDIATLTIEQKVDRRYWGMQKGSRMKDLRNALLAREPKRRVAVNDVVKPVKPAKVSMAKLTASSLVSTAKALIAGLKTEFQKTTPKEKVDVAQITKLLNDLEAELTPKS